MRDLLCPDSGSLEIREDSSGSITVSNLLDISASSTDVVLGMLRMGNTNRTSEPTVANRTSSRSHAILKVRKLAWDLFSIWIQLHSGLISPVYTLS